MFPASIRRSARQPSSPFARSARVSPTAVPNCEALEPRCLLASTTFVFSTGVPDGRIGTISEPANGQNENVEFESADDFILTQQTTITKASFIGLLPGSFKAKQLSNVVVEIYRVFPADSDTNRTPNVPTRVNSPSDVAFQTRDTAAKEIKVKTKVLAKSFSVANSVSTAGKIALASGGDGTVTGQEVRFDVTFNKKNALVLPADHYFFVPQVGFKDSAPEDTQFLWLSVAKPIAAPGTAFTPDLQSWMRDDPPLAPDWLRIGTDIITNTTFNAAFSLTGKT
jgi:hypothetical protein